MKTKLIACEVFAREVSLAVAHSPQIVDLKLMHFGLHDTPDLLREALQAEIDSTEEGVYDAIALGYGLCSRGTANLRAGTIPLVIPRAHDCITVLLGSRARYNTEFGQNPGTYYYSAGWIERKTGEVKQGFVDDKYAAMEQERYQEYVEKYGADNAKFLIEQESQWHSHYTRAALIDTSVGDLDCYRKFTQDIATARSWEYVEIAGDLALIQRLANGDWDNADFLTVPPGKRITESFDESVVRASGS